MSDYNFERYFKTQWYVDQANRLERIKRTALVNGMRLAFRGSASLKLDFPKLRPAFNQGAALMKPERGVRISQGRLGGVPVEWVHPLASDPKGVILYLHGGVFCLGNPQTHRALTTRLAKWSGASVAVVDYRLAPEHPYPAAMQDIEAVHKDLRHMGYQARQIAIAGDSAGGMLALALGMRIRNDWETPAAMLLLSPMTDGTLSSSSLQANHWSDPMLSRGYLARGYTAYQFEKADESHHPLIYSLEGLPPMLIQVGDQEVLLDDSLKLAEHARSCNVPVRLEIQDKHWHDYQLQAGVLPTAERATRRLAAFVKASFERNGELLQI